MAADAVAVAAGISVRTDWYQTEAAVVVTVLVKNLRGDDVRVDITERRLDVHLHSEATDHHLGFRLLHPVNATCSSYKVTPTKIEIKLKKVDGLRWERLEATAEEEAPVVVDEVGDRPPAYPTSKGTDWSAIEKEITAAEAKEKADGEDGLNQLFQKIYGEGSDDVKKAMNKSFMESGGTVLSTNWKEIAAKKVDVKPPDGMEFKKWDE